MYHIKYIERFNSENKKTRYTIYAKFRFKKEIPPLQRADVRKRVAGFLKQNPYHLSDEYLSDEVHFSSSYTSAKGLTRRVLNFDISLSCGEGVRAPNVPIKKIVDLDAINDYILTGAKNIKKKD